MWVYSPLSGKTYLGKMNSFEGFKISTEDNLLEIREGDMVKVEVTGFCKESTQFQRLFEGTVMKTDEDEDLKADFVVQAGDGSRHLVLINRRNRDLESPNVVVRDGEGSLIG